MARQEHWDYLLNALNKDLKKDDKMYKELCERFFGTDPSTVEKSVIIEKCASMAYGDLCRNLSGLRDMPDDKKGKWHEAVVSEIVACVQDLLDNPKDFDDWHKATCKAIRDKSVEHNVSDYVKWLKKHEHEGFSHGLAQKWLNMTLKNMLIAETASWYKKLDELRKLLHVPVDNYVIAAAHNVLGIREEKNKGFGSDPKWSRWNYVRYIDFQKKVRAAFESEGARGDYSCPIDWEFDAWISAKNNSTPSLEVFLSTFYNIDGDSDNQPN